MSYKINSIRIPEYDYSAENYFVTICSFKKEKIFSEIKNGNIYLTEIGKIIKDEILNTENIRQNIIIDDYVIMPNHIHFILIIDNNLFFANVGADLCVCPNEGEHTGSPLPRLKLVVAYE